MIRLPFLCLILASVAVSAQPDGHIEGTVTEETGAPLFGANITVTSSTGEYRTGTAAVAEGRFSIAVPEDSYRVEITFIGYKSELLENVQVRAGETTRIDAVLAEQVIYLEQSVVSASRRQEKVLDAPASVAIVEGSEIRDVPALSVGDHIKDLPGVDFAKIGVARSNAVVRGFNNVFSGTLLTLTDNRIARVPSLRVNAFNFIPLTNDDVERIEVVLGPGSALYGPNSADGVMHIITRSPFASQGTSVNLGLGERSLRQTAFRHAGAVGDRLGYKVSTQFYTSTEWEYTDPEEVEARELRQAAIEAGADLPPLEARDHDSMTRSVEARLDWRPTGRPDRHSVGGTQHVRRGRADRRGGRRRRWTGSTTTPSCGCCTATGSSRPSATGTMRGAPICCAPAIPSSTAPLSTCSRRSTPPAWAGASASLTVSTPC